jgi:two-component system chemotaxis sensor kinase CheA
MSASLKEFISEAEEILSEAEGYLVQLQESLDTSPDPDKLNALFRAIHTLKGNSSLFGQEDIKNLTHSLEELLDDLRMGRIPLNDNVIDFLFKEIDTLKGTIKALQSNKKVDLSQEIKRVDDFRKSASSAEQETSLKGLIDDEILKVLSEYEEHRLKENIKNKKGIFTLEVVLPLEGFDKKLQSISEKIKSVGELLSTLPTTKDVPAGSIGFKLLFGSEKDLEFLKNILQNEPKLIYAPAPPTPSPEKAPPPKSLETIKSTSSTVRVDIDKVDRILDTIGELYISKGMIKVVEQQLRQMYGYSDIVFEIHRASQMLERRLTELQQSVLDIRMVPIGHIFTRVAQLVRRYSRQMGKKIELQIYGEDTELDKYVAEEIVDPLMHIVRNSIDHGIEPPEERKRLGKPETGTLIMRAYQKGNHVVIEVEDDGRGINRQKLLNKALKMGLVKEDAELSENEILELIFTPGLSTKEETSEVSGRGVGMDVVKDKVTSLGGYVDIKSDEGNFTRISLTIPITLAIIKALIVKTSGHEFAVPLTSISETLELNRSLLNSIEGRLVYNLRGKAVPIVSLKEFYQLSEPDEEEKFIVVVGFEDRIIGIMADDLLGAHDIVIKSLGPYFEGFKGFSGAAEIGSGKLVLVIDTEAIISETLLRSRGENV